MDPADEPFPAGNVLDLVNEENPEARENFFEDEHERRKIVRCEIDEAFVIEVDVMERIVLLRDLPEERRLAAPADAGDCDDLAGFGILRDIDGSRYAGIPGEEDLLLAPGYLFELGNGNHFCILLMYVFVIYVYW